MIMTQKGSRKRKAAQDISVEDIYKNKNFVRPKEKPLETIFEEPKVSKDGIEHYTSVKRYKRYLHFDEYPTTDKLRKRKNRAKKYSKIMANDRRYTRSEVKRNEQNCSTQEDSFSVVDVTDCSQTSLHTLQDMPSNVEIVFLDENHMSHVPSNSNFTELRIEELTCEKKTSHLISAVSDDAIDYQKLNQCIIIEEHEIKNVSDESVACSMFNEKCASNELDSKGSFISIGEPSPDSEKIINRNSIYFESSSLETSQEKCEMEAKNVYFGNGSSVKNNSNNSWSESVCEIT